MRMIIWLATTAIGFALMLWSHFAFQRVGFVVRTERGPYYLYLAGLTMLLLGGSGCLIGLYAELEKRVLWPPLHEPLALLSSWRRLLWSIHVGYFGLTVAAAMVVFELPALQTMHLGKVDDALTADQGPLANAAKAYDSGNMVLAAGVTFLINFFLGSLALITLPSFVVPGVGVVAAAYRATLWGLLLAPTTAVLSSSMLSHSWTLLLEGEGYILAAFFAALIPVSLFSRGAEDRLWRRYRKACIANVKGNLLVAMVLLTAACYEAVEVITMMRMSSLDG